MNILYSRLLNNLSPAAVWWYNFREIRKGNEQWTREILAHDTEWRQTKQNKKQYNIKKKETQQAKMMDNTDPIKNRVVLTKVKTPAVLYI